MMRTEWPILYKKSAKTGVVNQWHVWTESFTIYVRQGQVGGKLQVYTTQCEGKNLGRSNETMPTDQAISEAQSKWEKQKKKGYVKDSSGESPLKLPMKVSVYQDNLGKVTFPCTVSPKLNGVNAEARLQDDGSIILLSRGGEEYALPKHWKAELEQLFQLFSTDSFNGEVYKHGEWLQDITGAMKKHRPLTDELEFHIFDLPTVGEEWKDRVYRLSGDEDPDTYGPIKFVENYEVTSHEEIEEYHKECVEEGYEGIIIRNYSGLYEYNTRSTDVFKMKVALSEEFLITGYSEDKYHHPVFTCNSKGGSFKAKPKGTDQQRKDILAEADQWVGKYLTVEFESYSKIGKPTKPVGITLREGYYDDDLKQFIPSE